MNFAHDRARFVDSRPRVRKIRRGELMPNISAGDTKRRWLPKELTTKIVEWVCFA